MQFSNVLLLKIGFCLLIVFRVLAAPQAVAETWQGYIKIEFSVADRQAFLIEPETSAAGRPWIWRMEFFGHQPQADIALLNKGFHVAYVDVQNLYGSPTAMTIMDAMYKHVVKEHKL